MAEVRWRADGPGDSIAGADAFKVVVHRPRIGRSDGTEWHVAPLYPWARAMLVAYAEAHGLTGYRSQLDSAGHLVVSQRQVARDLVAEVVSWARSWQP
jgi:hypothetical protein